MANKQLLRLLFSSAYVAFSDLFALAASLNGAHSRAVGVARIAHGIGVAREVVALVNACHRFQRRSDEAFIDELLTKISRRASWLV